MNDPTHDLEAYYVPKRRGAGAAAPARTPAARVTAKLGGVAATAALAGVSPSRVYRWLARGRVSARAQARLVANAAAAGVALSYADFAPRPGEAVLEGVL